MGSVFLRKYQLIFNVDSKIIGYYKQPQESSRENKENLNESNKGLVMFLLIMFSILSIVFGMYIQRKCCSTNRKLRANELEENFSYEGKLNIDKTNKIKNDKLIGEGEMKNSYLGMQYELVLIVYNK